MIPATSRAAGGGQEAGSPAKEPVAKAKAAEKKNKMRDFQASSGDVVVASPCSIHGPS